MANTSKKPTEYTAGTKCDVCMGTLGLEALTAAGRFIHPECFKCDDCKRLIIELHYYAVNNARLCTSCFKEKHLTKCAECHKPIDGTLSTIMLDKEYHLECPKCSKCRKSLSGGQYFVANNTAYCLQCHWEVRIAAYRKQKQTQGKPRAGDDTDT